MTAPADAAALLDQSLIRHLADLDRDAGGRFVSGLYQEFESNARKSLGQMRAQAGRGDAILIAREAHRLKGSSGSIGAARFSHSCLEIEQRARAENAAALSGSLDAAERTLEDTMGALAALLEQRARSAGSARSGA